MNLKPLIISLALALLWIGRPTVHAQEATDKLKDVEHIDAFHGSAEAREILLRQGFVVTGEEYRQIFSAYIASSLPKFITTDSAWHTYHVLLEEGVRKLEEAQAHRLKTFSTRLVELALSKSNDKQDPYMDIACFAGVGLTLQDPKSVESLDDAVKAEVQRLADKLQRGTGPVGIPFLGLPIMAGNLRANSFYAESPVLSGYFAARQWYATCDFQAKSKEESERALRLVLLIEGDPELKDLYTKLTLPYDELLGPSDDGDTQTYATIANEVFENDISEENLKAKMNAFIQALAVLPAPTVNDQILSPEQYAHFAEETKGFRLLPSRRLPSAIIFQNTVDPLVKGRMFPSGVDLLATGPLASKAGQRVMRDTIQDEGLADAILETTAGKTPDSLHGKALELLAKLQDPLPENAPEPFHTSDWNDKQLWTQLGAWAEQRHTWALHTKRAITYLCAFEEDAGFVSPYPKFFAGLADLARATAATLDKSTGEDTIDTKAAAQKLLETLKFLNDDQLIRGRTEEDFKKREEAYQFLESYYAEKPPASEIAGWRELRKLEQVARGWASGKTPDEADMNIIKISMNPYGRIPFLLQDFARLCDSLAAIAEKELAGKELDDDDISLIENYGQSLARFHFYGGNSWMFPRDDFPMVTPVFASPWGNQEETLYAGLGRPEALYIIIERGGKRILHRGAILSYREFRRPIGENLTDEAWRAEIRNDVAPTPPAFTKSFRNTELADAKIDVNKVVSIIKSGATYNDIWSVKDRKVTRAMIDTLLHATPKDKGWLRYHICLSAQAEDLGDLFKILDSTPEDNISEVVKCISRFPWVEYREKLLALLKDARPRYADSAAYIMAQRPEDIDVKRLLAQYEALPVRTRRLIIFLLGQIKNPDADVEFRLLKTLDDEDPGLRYESAKAIARNALKTPSIIKALTAHLEDPNEYVCAGAAMALRKLGAKETAPAMLARLTKGVSPRYIRTDESADQYRAVFEKLPYYGDITTVVLGYEDELNMTNDGGAKSLGDELIMSLGDFVYKPAKEPLEKMLSGNFGQEALDALRTIDPAGHLDRLITLANDRTSEIMTRENAIRELGLVGSPEIVTKFTAVLDDESPPGIKFNDDWRICDYAAQSIAAILEWPDNISYESDRATKDKLIAKIKKWAQEQH